MNLTKLCKPLKNHTMLKPGEKILAYYDYTVILDATEAAVLTDQRVFYYVNGRISQQLKLKQIKDIRDYDGELGIRFIVIKGAGGKTVNIEIAPFNGGSDFVRALNRAWENSKNTSG